MRNTILKLIGISGLIIAGFFALIFGFQNASEKVLAKGIPASELSLEIADVDIGTLEVIEDTYTENNEMSLREYFEEQLGYSLELINEFENYFNLDTTQTTFEELTSEQSEYLYHLWLLSEYADRPILTENQEDEFTHSLETIMTDVVAMSDKEKGTEIVTEICKKHQIDPNGIVSDLNIDIIKEIDDVLFEESDHPQ
ncbi:MAG: hypothetical protein ACRC3H_11750 [Lachnospiraceae bacterium]